jgi:hypothetical protein
MQTMPKSRIVRGSSSLARDAAKRLVHTTKEERQLNQQQTSQESTARVVGSISFTNSPNSKASTKKMPEFIINHVPPQHRYVFGNFCDLFKFKDFRIICNIGG